EPEPALREGQVAARERDPGQIDPDPAAFGIVGEALDEAGERALQPAASIGRCVRPLLAQRAELRLRLGTAGERHLGPKAGALAGATAPERAGGDRSCCAPQPAAQPLRRRAGLRGTWSRCPAHTPEICLISGAIAAPRASI